MKAKNEAQDKKKKKKSLFFFFLFIIGNESGIAVQLIFASKKERNSSCFWEDSFPSEPSIPNPTHKEGE